MRRTHSRDDTGDMALDPGSTNSSSRGGASHQRSNVQGVRNPGRPHYAPRIMSESSHMTPNQVPWGNASSPSSADLPTPLFYDVIRTIPPSSRSSNPFSNSPQRHQQHRPIPGSDPSRLPCEFAKYLGCQATFHSDDTEAWIAHIASHLGNSCPMHCICWFCNRQFVAQSNSPTNCWISYRARMHHIARHFRDQGLQAAHIRPDFFIIDHLRHHRLDTDEEFYHPRSTQANMRSHWRQGLGGVHQLESQLHESVIQNEQSILDVSAGMEQCQLAPLPRRSEEPDDNCDTLGLESIFERHGAGQYRDETYSNRLLPVNMEHDGSHRSPVESELTLESDQLSDSPSSNVEEDSGDATSSSSSKDIEDSSSNSDSTLSRSTRDMSLGEIVMLRRDALIDHLLVFFKIILAQKFSEWACGEAGEAHEQQTQSNPCHNESNPSEQRSQKINNRRKHRAGKDGNDDPGDNNDDDPKRQKRRKGEADTSLLFACPFLKHNEARRRPPKWTCCWHGWPTVHRVKEHLYRRHMLPRYQCNRCYQDLRTLARFTEHQRLPIPCQLANSEPQEGIGDDQERRLRSKKRNKEKVSEETRWIEVYAILFPNEELTPSPYQSLLFTEEQSREPHSVETVLQRFEAFAHNEFSRRMRPHIEGLVDRAVEQAFTAETLTNAFGTVLQSILTAFREDNNAHSNNPHDAIDPDTPTQIDIFTSAPGLLSELQEPISPNIYHGEQVEAPTTDIRFLVNMVDQVPSQELEFDFDSFLSSLDEEH